MFTGAAMAAHEPLLGVWRKITMACHESPSLTVLHLTMPELLALLDALHEVKPVLMYVVTLCT